MKFILWKETNIYQLQQLLTCYQDRNDVKFDVPLKR
jgi:hypothetical protein